MRLKCSLVFATLLNFTVSQTEQRVHRWEIKRVSYAPEFGINCDEPTSVLTLRRTNYDWARYNIHTACYSAREAHSSTNHPAGIFIHWHTLFAIRFALCWFHQHWISQQAPQTRDAYCESEKMSGVSMYVCQKKENEIWCGVSTTTIRIHACVRSLILGWHSQLTSSDRKLMISFAFVSFARLLSSSAQAQCNANRFGQEYTYNGVKTRNMLTSTHFILYFI